MASSALLRSGVSVVLFTRTDSSNADVMLQRPLHVEEVQSAEAFAQVAAEWDRLVGAYANPNIFLTSDWLLTWWQHYGQTRRWQTLLVRDDAGHLIGGLRLDAAADRVLHDSQALLYA